MNKRTTGFSAALWTQLDARSLSDDTTKSDKWSPSGLSVIKLCLSVTRGTSKRTQTEHSGNVLYTYSTGEIQQPNSQQPPPCSEKPMSTFWYALGLLCRRLCNALRRCGHVLGRWLLGLLLHRRLCRWQRLYVCIVRRLHGRRRVRVWLLLCLCVGRRVCCPDRIQSARGNELVREIAR